MSFGLNAGKEMGAKISLLRSIDPASERSPRFFCSAFAPIRAQTLALPVVQFCPSSVRLLERKLHSLSLSLSSKPLSCFVFSFCLQTIQRSEELPRRVRELQTRDGQNIFNLLTRTSNNNNNNNHHRCAQILQARPNRRGENSAEHHRLGANNRRVAPADQGRKRQRPGE